MEKLNQLFSKLKDVLKMNTQELFQLNTLRCEVAMQVVLKYWLPPHDYSSIKCPKCQSVDVFLGRRKTIPIYRCRSCKSEFKPKLTMECSCSVPGSQPSCKDCPQFKKFLHEVRTVADNLRTLNLEELQRLKT